MEILGQVYEQFLGKVIRLTPGRQAKIEEKPEVRKAGGVYYTPSYIVDYIVTNTVGKLVAGRTPDQVSLIRILDPACGENVITMPKGKNLSNQKGFRASTKYEIRKMLQYALIFCVL